MCMVVENGCGMRVLKKKKQIANKGPMLYQNGWLRFLRLKNGLYEWGGWFYGMAMIQSIYLW